jgi:hypothetical protein
MPDPNNTNTPPTRTPTTGGLSNEEFDRGTGKGRQPPPNPKTSGAAAPGPDTSRSPVANRNREGPRQAGATPRPKSNPID